MPMPTPAPKPKFQPRYEAYAASRGLSPAAALEADELLWPGGLMAGFMLWISRKWAEYCSVTGASRYELWDFDHAAFDAWIWNRASLVGRQPCVRGQSRQRRR